MVKTTKVHAIQSTDLRALELDSDMGEEFYIVLQKLVVEDLDDQHYNGVNSFTAFSVF